MPKLGVRLWQDYPIKHLTYHRDCELNGAGQKFHGQMERVRLIGMSDKAPIRLGTDMSALSESTPSMLEAKSYPTSQSGVAHLLPECLPPKIM